MDNFQYFAVPVKWQKIDDPHFPYQAVVNAQVWVLRINDFPEEELWTLFVDNIEIGSFNAWSSNWERP